MSPALSRLAAAYVQGLPGDERLALARAVEVAETLADVVEPWKSRLRVFGLAHPDRRWSDMVNTDQ